MAIKKQEGGLEEEFKELYSTAEFASECRDLSIVLKSGRTKNLWERYLKSKGVVNLDSNNNIISVVENNYNNFKKYDTIYRNWAIANLPKGDISKFKSKTV